MKKTTLTQRVFPALLAAVLIFSLFPLSAYAASEYTTSGATYFAFASGKITATDGSYTGYAISGTDLTIQSAGTYIVSGSCSDGSITVKKGVTGVTLVLNGLTLVSDDTAPITCNKSSGVTIVAASGTVNKLTDAAYNNDDNYPDNELAENAVIKCKDGSQVTICGTGTLNIVSKGKNGIKSGATTEAEGEAWMVIRDVTLNVTAAVNDGINAEQRLTISSGTITVSAADDGIHSDYSLTIGASGTTGPTILISKSNEGIEAATLAIHSGNIEVHATDDGINAANSDLTGYAFSVVISGGTVYVDVSNGDGIDSNGTITISGGTVQIYSVSAGDGDPLDSDGTCSITGGTVLAVGHAGMGVNISASQPYVVFGGGAGGMGNQGAGQRGGQTSQNASLSIAANSTIAVKDASGNTLFSGKTVRSASYVLFSSPSLTSGGSYTLYSGSSSVATATATAGSSNAGSQGPGGMQFPGGQNQPGSAPSSGGQGNPTGGAAETGGFSDVLSSDWYGESVKYVYGKGLMNGTSATTFEPNSITSRAMIVTILYRLDGSPAVSGSGSFSDVASGTYYADAVKWAEQNGIATGYSSGVFAPNDGISREQLAAILYRYASYKGYDSSQLADLSAFTDSGSISSYAATAMAWANQAGIISGMGNGSLNPGGNATRAQLAAILMRFCESFAA